MHTTRTHTEELPMAAKTPTQWYLQFCADVELDPNTVEAFDAWAEMVGELAAVEAADAIRAQYPATDPSYDGPVVALGEDADGEELFKCSKCGGVTSEEEATFTMLPTGEVVTCVDCSPKPECECGDHHNWDEDHHGVNESCPREGTAQYGGVWLCDVCATGMPQ